MNDIRQSAITRSLYNPGWLSDDDLVAGFAARHELFDFLRGELARVPPNGGVQHYVLVGVRGSGKTTLLNRLAVAIRREPNLQRQLIGLAFPEELYQIKSLADFWWAACEALEEALTRVSLHGAADRLAAAIDARHGGVRANRVDDDSGLRLLQSTCAELQRRPVMLIDNFDMVLERIDKRGRKLNDPHSASYWALREALSTADAPIVIAGSVRLSEPFTHYDKAFYDFFVPKRLGKLSFADARAMLYRLAETQGSSQVKERLLRQRGRTRALYDMTGGNPRAISLIFDLLRQEADRRAVEDFERLMDVTTPYYKARLEELSEQAQIVMHGLALCRRRVPAANVARQTGLDTRTVSTQLDILEREGVVEKQAGNGRTRYCVSEQLFRLWLQMRSGRRLRQRVAYLTEFLEALYDREEIEKLALTLRSGNSGEMWTSRAGRAYALGRAHGRSSLGHALQAHAADLVVEHGLRDGATFEDYFGNADLPTDLGAIGELREAIKSHVPKLQAEVPDASEIIADMIGAIGLSLHEKRTSVHRLSGAHAATELGRLRSVVAYERERLQRIGLSVAEIDLLFAVRSRGFFPLPHLHAQDVEAAMRVTSFQGLDHIAWRLLCAQMVEVNSSEAAASWITFGMKSVPAATSDDWARVARAFRRANWLVLASQALDCAFTLTPAALAWHERGVINDVTGGPPEETETAFRKSIELDPARTSSWCRLGVLLSERLGKQSEAESALRKAVQLQPRDAYAWCQLGVVLSDLAGRYEEAGAAFRTAIGLDAEDAFPRFLLVDLLRRRLGRHADALAVAREAIERIPSDGHLRYELAVLLTEFDRHEEAEAAFRKSIELAPEFAAPWHGLGNLLTSHLHRHAEAEAAYLKAIELNSTHAEPWYGLGTVLALHLGRANEAEIAYRKAIELDPGNASSWNALGMVFTAYLNRFDDAEAAFRKAIELQPNEPVWWANLAQVLDICLERDDDAQVAYRRALALGPDPSIEAALNRLGRKRSLASVKASIEARDWGALSAALRQLANDDQVDWVALVNEGFVEDALGRALRTGSGARVLEILREVGIDKLAGPLVTALEAKHLNNSDILMNAAPEERAATELLFGRLTEAMNRSG